MMMRCICGSRARRVNKTTTDRRRRRRTNERAKTKKMTASRHHRRAEKAKDTKDNTTPPSSQGSKRRKNAKKKHVTNAYLTGDCLAVGSVLVAALYLVVSYDIVYSLSSTQRIAMRLIYRIAQFSQCRSLFKSNSFLWTVPVCVLMAYTGHSVVRILVGKVPAWYTDMTSWYYVLSAYFVVFLSPTDLIQQSAIRRLLVAFGVTIHKFLDQANIVDMAVAMGQPLHFAAFLCSIDMIMSSVVLRVANFIRNRKTFSSMITVSTLVNEAWEFVYPGCLTCIPLFYARRFDSRPEVSMLCDAVAIGFLLLRLCRRALTLAMRSVVDDFTRLKRKNKYL